MLEKPRLVLRTVSVVVNAEFHNPSILNPDFLVSREIVPADWTVLETVTTPTLSVVRYENGVTWTVNPAQLTITQPTGPDFADNCDVHRLASLYLEKLPYVPYRSLGLNCEIAVSEPQPRRNHERLPLWETGPPPRSALETLREPQDERNPTPKLASRAGMTVRQGSR